MDYSIGDFFSSVIKLFALLTPPAALSAFLSGTQTYGGRRKRRTALRTGLRSSSWDGAVLFRGIAVQRIRLHAGRLPHRRRGAPVPDFRSPCMGEQRESHTPDQP